MPLLLAPLSSQHIPGYRMSGGWTHVPVTVFTCVGEVGSGPAWPHSIGDGAKRQRGVGAKGSHPPPAPYPPPMMGALPTLLTHQSM